MTLDMRIYQTAKPLFLAIIGASACVADVGQTVQAIHNGAIFTTLEDGSIVNANIYSAKEDVYLDGGPGPKAPAGSAALPEGDYFFQVTDPSGMTLLSTDSIFCRRIHIDADGVIDAVIEGPGGCEHDTGIDQDHADLGAITVQLFPYADTPNPGNEYKVWITPVSAYNPAQTRFHGFVPSNTKTDNFKVIASAPPPPPVCGDGHVDEGEECDDGNTTDGDGCSANCTVEEEEKPVCGDGNVDEGEECDDGNTTDGDGCSANCRVEEEEKPPCCGDGKVDAGEECDDGNTTDGDGCSATCTVEEEVCPPVT